jgi:phage shock protein A
VPRLSPDTRQRNEAAIRAAMTRLLQGQIPPGGGCDLKTLAAEAGITRTGFYPKGDRPGPYQHLADEFHQRLKALQDNGTNPDPRDAQITRLKTENRALKDRLTAAQTTITELTTFKQLALSRLAAQHDEIQRLRTHPPDHPAPDNVRRLHPAPSRHRPQPATTTQPSPHTPHPNKDHM